jgi:hypothetical protein
MQILGLVAPERRRHRAAAERIATAHSTQQRIAAHDRRPHGHAAPSLPQGASERDEVGRLGPEQTVAPPHQATPDSGGQIRAGFVLDDSLERFYHRMCIP